MEKAKPFQYSDRTKVLIGAAALSVAATVSGWIYIALNKETRELFLKSQMRAEMKTQDQKSLAEEKITSKTIEVRPPMPIEPPKERLVQGYVEALPGENGRAKYVVVSNSKHANLLLDSIKEYNRATGR